MQFVSYKDKTNINLALVVSISLKAEASRKGVAKIIFNLAGSNIGVNWFFDSMDEAKEVFAFIKEKYFLQIDIELEAEKRRS